MPETLKIKDLPIEARPREAFMRSAKRATSSASRSTTTSSSAQAGITSR